MGYSRWDEHTYRSFTSQIHNKSRDEIFTSKNLDEGLDPAKVQFRESVDSPNNPQSTPIILAADETGSMGQLAEQIIRHGLGTVMKEIYERKPVTDPHILCAGIGDAFCDQAPLQVTQFESEVDPLVKQVQKIWLEANGGGNGGESYALMWWFAANKIKADAFTKRGRKGYLFTIGDESCHKLIEGGQLGRFLGVRGEQARDHAAQEILQEAQRNWHVFHLIVKPVTDQPVVPSWKALLNERAILVPDVETLAEGIVSVIEVVEGMDPTSVVGRWDVSKAKTVRAVVQQLGAGGK